MQNIIRKIIREQINLLFETFDMKSNSNKMFTPNTQVAEIAKKALETIQFAQKKGIQLSSLDENGNEGSGRLKAQELSKRVPQNFAKMNRLKAFFQANSAKVEEERKNLGIIQQRRGTPDEMTKSKILLVWNLHGGDVGKKWVESQLSNIHKQGLKKKERLRKIGGAYKNNGIGVFKTQFDPSQQRINR
jgi:hypothetical protein